MLSQSNVAEKWRDRFLDLAGCNEFASHLKFASLDGDLGVWTEVLTHLVVRVCSELGWAAAAKGHRVDFLPERKYEFLGIDVTAFEDSNGVWRFPVAAVELENSSMDDRVAYSLWKVLNLRTELRVVYCYRRDRDAAPPLIQKLAEDVIEALGIPGRQSLDGRTIVAVGYRNKAETFPYGYFKWWELNCNTGRFEILK